MKKEFGNVKGFSTAICLLEPDEQSDLLVLISGTKEDFDEIINNEGGSFYSRAALALATIYHANNEAE